MTFEKWWKDAWMLEQNFRDADTREYGYAKAAWDARQSEIDELKDLVDLLLSRCDKNLQYCDDYSEIMERIKKINIGTKNG